MEPGPECYCPNDYDGDVQVGCAVMHCNGVPTHADNSGQFYCPQHAVQPYRTTPFEEIASWSAGTQVSAGGGADG